VSWKKLSIAGIDAVHNPTRAAIGTVTLVQPAGSVYLTKEGRPNVLGIVRQQGGPEQVAAPARESSAESGKALEIPVSVGKVIVRKGEMDFTDKSATPVFSTAFEKVDCTVSGISTDKNSRADIDFSGYMNGHAPLTIKGSLNPLGDDLFLDLALLFKNMDLTPFTPYSGRFAGYTIRKGQLSLDLDYELENNALAARNNVLIDQFEFGEEVESEDAVNLPVRLGVALLKDRNDQIRLDIPVGGQLDDPEFSIGGIILDVIVNILTKAATAPFP
jgi:hypothetical protein